MTKSFIQQSCVESKGYEEHGKSRSVNPFRLKEFIEPTFGLLNVEGVDRSLLHSNLNRSEIAEINEIKKNQKKYQYNPVTLDELLSNPISPRPTILAPWLPECGLGMIYSWRGTGKSFFLVSLSYAVATGGEFLGWSADRPRKTLYVDGEMSIHSQHERLKKLFGSKPQSPNLSFIFADGMERGIAKLDTLEGQMVMERCLEGVELLVLDNLSCLLSGDENDSNSWVPFQDWLLNLRRRGITVLIAHHAAKQGQQRGLSRREDTLDVVINLKQPENYKPESGCRFTVQFEKCRDCFGDAVKSFEAGLIETEEGLDWYVSRELISTEQTKKPQKKWDKREKNNRVMKLRASGLTIREIAETINIPISTVGDIVQMENKILSETCPDLSENRVRSVRSTPPLKRGGVDSRTGQTSFGQQEEFFDKVVDREKFSSYGEKSRTARVLTPPGRS